MKPTKGKPSQSSPIRKGKVSDEEIKRTAEELTKWQIIAWSRQMGTKFASSILEEVKAPKIEPVFAQKQVKTPWNYKVYAEALKAMISEHETVEVTGDQLHEIFPQARCGWEVALQLKRSHWLSYRRVENGRNDTYIFFVEPTREELIVQLTSAESKVIELEQLWFETYSRQFDYIQELKEENTQLKSDLNNSQKTNKILFAFAIWAVITILFKSVAL